MIYLNLIPRNMWYLNLRKMLSKESWDNLSKKIRSEQDYTCFCCGINSTKIPKNKFHTHEAWWFDDKHHTVELKALICICEACHTATHFGFAGIKNKSKESFNRIMRVNQWNYEMTNIYIESEFETWAKRSNIQWIIDLNTFKDWIDDSLVEQVRTYLIDNHIEFKE